LAARGLSGDQVLDLKGNHVAEAPAFAAASKGVRGKLADIQCHRVQRDGRRPAGQPPHADPPRHSRRLTGLANRAALTERLAASFKSGSDLRTRP
jgi:hypothetical protein